MTEEMHRRLTRQIDGLELPVTGNTEALTEDELSRAYRGKVRTLVQIVRALLVDAGRRLTPDDTIVPADRSGAWTGLPRRAPDPAPFVPEPETLEEPDRWAWVLPAAKGAIYLTSALLHLAEATALVWLALEVYQLSQR